MIYSINMHTTVYQFNGLYINLNIIYAIILYEDQIARISFIMAPTVVFGPLQLI